MSNKPIKVAIYTDENLTSTILYWLLFFSMCAPWLTKVHRIIMFLSWLYLYFCSVCTVLCMTRLWSSLYGWPEAMCGAGSRSVLCLVPGWPMCAVLSLTTGGKSHHLQLSASRWASCQLGLE